MTLMVKFIVGFAAPGLIISAIFGFVSGNPWPSVILTALLSSLFSAAVGGGVYKMMELRVPELLSLFSGGDMGAELSSESDFTNEGALDEEGIDFDEESSATAAAHAAESDSLDDVFKTTTFGDHILVNKIKIRNEPKLMARAIRDMLARDD